MSDITQIPTQEHVAQGNPPSRQTRRRRPADVDLPAAASSRNKPPPAVHFLIPTLRNKRHSGENSYQPDQKPPHNNDDVLFLSNQQRHYNPILTKRPRTPP